MPSVIALLLLLAGPAPQLPAARAAASPTIDGRLDEAAWRAAPASDGFTQRIPDEGRPPSERTEVRVLYDDAALYFGISCDQRQSPITPRLTRRDRDLRLDDSKLGGRPDIRADEVSVSIDSRRDGTATAFHFVVNVSGVLSDGMYYNDVQLDPSWDGTWDAATHQTPTGWTAELRIPLRALRFTEQPTQSFGLNVRRTIAHRQEIAEWSFVPRAEAGYVSRFGTLTELHGLPAPRADVELRPFVLTKVGRQDAALGPLRGSSGPATWSRAWAGDGGTSTGVASSVGLDAHWHVTRDLTLDATFNPDFGQVEADQVVLNLSTIETFHPEKRPFFLEGLDIFAMPASTLYTRRIGRVPAAPELAPGEVAREGVGPSAILGAVKATGRIGERTTVGVLSAMTDRNDVAVTNAAGLTQRRLADPFTTFNVLRVRRAAGTTGHVGLMATATNRIEPGGACGTGGTSSDCFNDAYVGVADGRWRSPSGDYVLVGVGGASMLAGGPPRAKPDGSVIRAGEPGIGAVAGVLKEGGHRWLWNVVGSFTGRDVDVNDLGYMGRQNIGEGSFDLAYRTRERWGPTLETSTKLELRHGRNLDGLVLQDYHQLNSTWLLTNQFRAFLEVHHRNVYFDDREIGEGTALERPRRVGVEAAVWGDPRRAVSGRLFALGQLGGGGLHGRVEGALIVRPSASLDLELAPDLVHTSGEPRYIAGAATDRLLFGRLRATQVGGTLRATLTFTPRLTLQSYAQLFLARGHYSDLSSFDRPAGTRARVHLDDLIATTDRPAENPDFQRAGVNASLVLRWEYALGSTFYLVYTRAQIPQLQLQLDDTPRLDLGALPRAPAADVVLAKLTWWWS